MAESGADEEPRRFPVWSIATALTLGIALLVAIIWGIALAANGGQTPLESYIFTALLTVLSILGGWIIAVLLYQSQSYDRRVADRRQQEDLERSARSAVARSFRITSAIQRIQGHADVETAHNVTELRTRMRIICEAALTSVEHTLDAIEDWRRFAPEVVDNEIEKAMKASIRRKEGWDE